MFFKSKSSQKYEDARLVDLPEPLRKEVAHLTKLILGSMAEDGSLSSESMAIAIQGGWGAGKTYTGHVIINQLRNVWPSDKLHVFCFDLLPFGNINESVINILSTVGQELWDRGLADVRSELRFATRDVTPEHEVNVGVAAFGFSLAKKMHYRQSKDYMQSLRCKLGAVVERGHLVVIMLDDLDRMRPDEVLIVLRMVELFKSTPGIIFMLPFHRSAITGAVKEELRLDDASSHVYLRKFLKASITIELSVSDLKYSFMQGFGTRQEHKRVLPNEDNLAESVWYMLLHFIIVGETIQAINTASPNGVQGAVERFYDNPEASYYMSQLPGRLRYKTFAYSTDNVVQPFAQVYPGLAQSKEKLNHANLLRELSGLTNAEMLVNSVSENSVIVKMLNDKRQKLQTWDDEGGLLTPYVQLTQEEAQFRPRMHDTVFEKICLPILKKNGIENEPRLTENYSRRDMEQLAQAIHNDPDIIMKGDHRGVLFNLLKITKKCFEEFR